MIHLLNNRCDKYHCDIARKSTHREDCKSEDAPENLVNVRVDNHWKLLDEDKSAVHPDANWSHSWHFDDKQFAQDLLYTLQGDVDRGSIETRHYIGGELHLKVAQQEAD